MAHNLYQNRMAYTGEVPWHQLGTQFPEPMTAEQCIEAAGLGYQVAKEQLHLVRGEGESRLDIPVDAFATINMDTLDVLGIVGDRYTPVQNREAFQFFDTLLDECGATYQTAGALGKGERIWLLAKMPESFEPLLGDKVDQFCLLSNSHDGSSAVTVRFTPIRVVCQNTLTAAMRGSRETISIRHTTNAQGRLQESAIILKQYRDHFARLQTTFQEFAQFRIDDQWLEEYEAALFGRFEDTPKGAATTRLENKIQAFEKRLREGMGVDIQGVTGSAWGAYNAAVEWADYEFPMQKATDRVESILWGGANDFKQKAFDSALALVRAS